MGAGGRATTTESDEQAALIVERTLRLLSELQEIEGWLGILEEALQEAARRVIRSH